MAMNSNGGQPAKPLVRVEELTGSIVLKDVKVIEQRQTVEIPEIKYVEKTYEVPVIKEVETLKFNMVEESTTKFIPVDEPTTRYVVKDVECERPIIKEVEYEKPIVTTKNYEKPVIQEKVYEIASVKNLDEVIKATETIKGLCASLAELRTHLEALKDYKLVEEIVRVPKIEYYNVPVERIVWKDIVRDKV